MAFGAPRCYHRLVTAIEDAGWIIRDCILWIYGEGFPKSQNISKGIWFKKSSNKFEGYGTALKPAYEPIVLAMKPIDGNFVDNALKWGVSGLNIDGARIDSTDENRRKKGGFAAKSDIYHNKEEYKVNTFETSEPKGRWPANVILDPEAGAMLDSQSGDLGLSHGGNSAMSKDSIFNKNKEVDQQKLGVKCGFNDRGGASRFFYCAKASKTEKEKGLESFEAKKVNDGRKTEIDNPYQRGETDRKNIHPTVKPIKLMEYLCNLTRPPGGGVVLDPFMGSGSTGVACKNTDRDFIGIEMNPDYFEIAKTRIDSTGPIIDIEGKVYENIVVENKIFKQGRLF